MAGKKKGKGKIKGKIKGKKGKGKKGKRKVKKGVIKRISQPPKFFAKVYRYIFADEQKFLFYLCEIDLNLPLYVLMMEKDDRINASNDSDIHLSKLEIEIDKFINYMQQEPDARDINFVTVLMDPEKLGSLSSFPPIGLDVLPTLVRWGGHQKLEGYDRCTNPDQLCLLFEDERRETMCPAGPDTFTDDNKNLCPYLPTGEEPEVVPTEPLDKPKVRKKSKPRKKKGTKKKGAKKKGAKKKGKGGKKGKKK